MGRPQSRSKSTVRHQLSQSGSPSETAGGKHRSEFRYGSFTRSLPLPANADQDDITAAYHDGILTVSVGLKVEKKEAVKKIEVKSGK